MVWSQLFVLRLWQLTAGNYGTVAMVMLFWHGGHRVIVDAWTAEG